MPKQRFDPLLHGDDNDRELLKELRDLRGRIAANRRQHDDLMKRRWELIDECQEANWPSRTIAKELDISPSTLSVSNPRTKDE